MSFSSISFSFSEKKSVSSLVDDLPFFQVSLSLKLLFLKNYLQGSIPYVITSVCDSLKNILTLYFLSQTNQPGLVAVAGLGHLWSLVFCLGVLISINYSFGIQAHIYYQNRNYHALGLCFQKNLATVAVVGLFLVLTLILTEDVLLLFGVESNIANGTRNYVLMLIPSYFAIAAFGAQNFYSLATGQSQIQLYLSVFSLIAYFFLCELFLTILELDLEGVAFARNLTECLVTTIFYGYLEFFNPCKESWFSWSRECLDDFWLTIKGALGKGVDLYVNWMALELPLLVVSMIGDVEVAACYSIVLSLFLFYGGIQSSLVAPLLKNFSKACVNKQENKARNTIIIGFVITVIGILSGFMISWLLRVPLVWIFTMNENSLREGLEKILSVYGIFLVFDWTIKYLSALLIVIGKEQTVKFAYRTGFYLVGMTLSLILGLFTGLGYQGVLIGVGLGMLAVVVQLINSWMKNSDSWKEALENERDLMTPLQDFSFSVHG